MTLRFLKALATVTGFFLILTRPVAAQSGGSTLQSGGSALQQNIINGVVQNIIQSVRDQIHGRRLVSPPGRLGFNADESDFDNLDPFAVHGSSDPSRALGYAKAPVMAPDSGSAWLYGANVVGDGDKSVTSGTSTYVSTATGAFDVTKIGIFTASDSLTFIATGSGSWAHQGGFVSVDSSTPATSGTLSYSNGGFSTDFTGFASWTRSTVSIVAFPAAIEGSLLGYTGNAQYRFDLPYSVFIEPTLGVTYTEGYTANFGAKISDTTEVHGGARFGTEVKWIGYTVQPTLSASVYQTVDSSAVGVAGPIVPPSVIGFRSSGKVTVIWTPSFSSFLEVHAIGMTGPSKPILGFSTTQTTGAQAGLRYSWN